ncbi:MAG: hypothetical protein AB1942_05360 [Pseudomonadota bacterium]
METIEEPVGLPKAVQDQPAPIKTIDTPPGPPTSADDQSDVLKTIDEAVFSALSSLSDTEDDLREIYARERRSDDRSKFWLRFLSGSSVVIGICSFLFTALKSDGTLTDGVDIILATLSLALSVYILQVANSRLSADFARRSTFLAKAIEQTSRLQAARHVDWQRLKLDARASGDLTEMYRFLEALLAEKQEVSLQAHGAGRSSDPSPPAN